MRKSKPRTETRASQSRELGELSALARVREERKQKRLLCHSHKDERSLTGGRFYLLIELLEKS
nr:MAG TPA: hypothetical protein [Caudoviricetes sp.]